MNRKSMPSLEAMYLLGGSIDAAKKNTFDDRVWVSMMNNACSGGAAICVRLTIDASLKMAEVKDFGNGLVLRIYADEIGPRLNLFVHGAVNLNGLVLASLTVDPNPIQGSGMITLQVFPISNPDYIFDGHMWFGNVQMSFGAVSNGMTEIHSVSIHSVPHMQARYGAGLISAFAHFLNGFTFVFASSEADLPDNSAFFRFRKGFLETQTVSVTALGMEVGSGCFYAIGDKKYESSPLVVDRTDHIALMYAFREGVGAFNLEHLTKTSGTEKDPEKFAKACWKRVVKMADEGLFTFVSTQKGMFANPTPELLLSL